LYDHGYMIIVLIDSTLQAYRATKRANATVNLTGDPSASKLIPPSPLIKQESPPKPADASTPKQVAIKPPATVQTYKWSPKPTTDCDTHIRYDSFLKTITTAYPGAAQNIILTCTYANNPQAALTVALQMLGTTLPADVLQGMFKYDLTKSNKTLAAVLKEHNANKHIQFEDYASAVADRNLTPGISALFLGYSGPNFGGETGFTNSHPILCQMESEAPKVTNQRRTYHWQLFLPHMNTIITCHDYEDSGKTKHARVLGTAILDFFKEGNHGRIDQRMEKLIFPYKADNATDLKLISAVFITGKSKNLNL
jgi:hypothetical protein